MTKQQFYVTLVFTILAGFLGGVFSGFLFHSGMVRAQSEHVIPKVIRAERFEVVSETGLLLGTLTRGETETDGQLLLYKYNKHETVVPETLTFVSPSSLGLDMNSERGQYSVWLGSNKGVKGISIFNQDGMEAISLISNEEHSSALRIFDQTGTIRTIVGNGETLGPFLSLRDQRQIERVLVRIGKDGFGRISMRDARAIERVALYEGKGAAGVMVNDDYRQGPAGFGESGGTGLMFP